MALNTIHSISVPHVPQTQISISAVSPEIRNKLYTAFGAVLKHTTGIPAIRILKVRQSLPRNHSRVIIENSSSVFGMAMDRRAFSGASLIWCKQGQRNRLVKVVCAALVDQVAEGYPASFLGTGASSQSPQHSWHVGSASHIVENGLARTTAPVGGRTHF